MAVVEISLGVLGVWCLHPDMSFIQPGSSTPRIHCRCYRLLLFVWACAWPAMADSLIVRNDGDKNHGVKKGHYICSCSEEDPTTAL